MKHPDIVSGSVLLIIGAVVVAASRNIEVNQLDTGLSAAFFPTLCGGVLAAIGGVLAIRGLIAERVAMPFIADRRVAAIAAVFVIYFFSFTYVDFRVGAWAILLVAMLLLGARRPRELALVPVGVSAGIFVLFKYGLQIQVPAWI